MIIHVDEDGVFDKTFKEIEEAARVYELTIKEVSVTDEDDYPVLGGK